MYKNASVTVPPSKVLETKIAHPVGVRAGRILRERTAAWAWACAHTYIMSPRAALGHIPICFSFYLLSVAEGRALCSYSDSRAKVPFVRHWLPVVNIYTNNHGTAETGTP